MLKKVSAQNEVIGTCPFRLTIQGTRRKTFLKGFLKNLKHSLTFCTSGAKGLNFQEKLKGVGGGS